ncbi:hypothetical protein [Aeromicrobium sp.]|uniref:hypothetical protein n=1 Tax=Aeromicrobium sp. TaxID=1871063 RepID=UPI0019914BE8|nr:hypothetical protein [Aeromicrobium sp.]MBC7633424.1 hypothetical protein [Aeromicrobium sp.]
MTTVASTAPVNESARDLSLVGIRRAVLARDGALWGHVDRRAGFGNSLLHFPG